MAACGSTTVGSKAFVPEGGVCARTAGAHHPTTMTTVIATNATGIRVRIDIPPANALRNQHQEQVRHFPAEPRQMVVLIARSCRSRFSLAHATSPRKTLGI